jgi:hypothetical protein
MTRIVLAVEIAGTRNGKVWPPVGTEIDLPEDEANALLASGSALEPDDERVASLAGPVLTDVDLVGAPTSRDSTEGQPDTNLARAQALAVEHQGDEDAVRAQTRELAEKLNYTDPQAPRPDGPVVGDDNPAPAHTPAAIDPAPIEAAGDGKDDAKLVKPAAKSDAPADKSTAKGVGHTVDTKSGLTKS